MYTTILVHCNDRRRIKQVLAPALALAERFESHLIALSVVPPVDIISGGADMTPIVDESQSIDYREHNAEMRAAFDAAIVSRSIKPEWRDVDAGAFSVADTALPLARSADLIVASQTDDAWFGSAHLDIVEPLVLESGRPVLIIPNRDTGASVGTRVVIAWNGGRESARAVFDAMPLLQRAQSVKVVWVSQVGEEDHTQIPVVDICATLARHGVACEGTGQAAASEGVGEDLLRAAADYKADLLVMGCYGHSRLRELVFGGASRTVLANMKIPVLMSH
jgi:nucleotide-binding universal stress UspA family protein